MFHPLEQSLVKYLRTDFQTYIYAKYVADAAAPPGHHITEERR